MSDKETGSADSQPYLRILRMQYDVKWTSRLTGYFLKMPKLRRCYIEGRGYIRI